MKKKAPQPPEIMTPGSKEMLAWASEVTFDALITGGANQMRAQLHNVIDVAARSAVEWDTYRRAASGEQNANSAHKGLPKEIVHWLADGERCLCSDALCKALYGLPTHAGEETPHTAADFARCLNFIEQTGSERLLPQAKEISPGWASVVENWSEITSMAKHPCAGGSAKKFKKIAKRLRELESEARRTD